MDLEDKQQQVTRWIDGELSPEELPAFEAHASKDPQLSAAKKQAEQLRRLLQAEMPARQIPNPEFFNSQIQRRITEDATPHTPTTVPAASGNIFSWFRSPFTLASAAAILLFGFITFSRSSPDHTSVASTYTPDREITARHFYSDDAAATVIMLDGLAALPDDTEIKGQNIVSAEQGAPGELYNTHNQLTFVVIQGPDSAPIIRSF